MLYVLLLMFMSKLITLLSSTNSINQITVPTANGYATGSSWLLLLCKLTAAAA